MKIQMLETKQGSLDGIFVKTFHKDQVYDIPDRLYESFKKMKCCKEITDEEEIDKSLDSAPSNKMADTKKTNKKG
jgi:hypothetical protein